jgi:Teichoic acid biosynthesis proteins
MIPTCQILGIQFFNGDVDEAVRSMTRRGGFLIAPSGTCFARLREDERYRRAVLAADLAIADSGLMVLLCRLFRRESLQRISGLKYLKHLLATVERRGKGRSFLDRSQRSREAKTIGLVAAGSVPDCRRGLLRCAVLRIRRCRSNSCCAD